MDVKSAFINGILQEEVYVSQPEGFMDPKFPDHVYVLDKALYGLKQAPRAWYETLSVYLTESGFRKGLQVKQTPEGIFINQGKYIRDMLKKFDMNSTSPMKTPMQAGSLLDADISGKSVDQHTYRSMIGSLLYLTGSRPDIMFATCFCARYQKNPKESHLSAVKRILRYLKGTPNLGLWYPKDSKVELIAYTDANHVGNKLDRNNTSGACHYLGDKLVSWSSKKQNCVSTSTAEAEYVAAASCCSQVLWMRTQLRDYGYTFHKVPIYCDSKSEIAITSNPVQHSKMKHINIRFAYCTMTSGHIRSGLVLHDLCFTAKIKGEILRYVHTSRGSSMQKSRTMLTLKRARHSLKSMEEENINDQSVQMDEHDPNDSRKMPMPSSRSHYSEIGADPDLQLINPQDYLSLSPNNHQVIFDNLMVKPLIKEILKNHPICNALTATTTVPMIYLQQAWKTIEHVVQGIRKYFTIRIDNFTSILTYQRLRLLLDLPLPDSR
ncbi:hypothetical protein L6452_15373 [Arctium lappa]|uniref:Uncharacterized protein n=1 Tax=Arctium lappa TaxID=4217 RepID=A0ACB9CP63_ARCLA|nr:hypothetical protein L6452_15373 [Arctium lappa]